MNTSNESQDNPYLASQSVEPVPMPNWLEKHWIYIKQVIDQPAPPIETWSSAFLQLYRWLAMNLILGNFLALWSLRKLCSRWRFLVLVVVCGIAAFGMITLGTFAVLDFISRRLIIKSV